MDTSETYIKMNEKAVEIQSAKQAYNKGDYYSDYVMRAYPIVLECHPYGCVKSSTIWLPRQDQLQAMWEENTIDKIARFTRFVFDEFRYKRFSNFKAKTSNNILSTKALWEPTSMERLWLAFVMKERYSKIWNGTDWTIQ